jgi:hypothetical protein
MRIRIGRLTPNRGISPMANRRLVVHPNRAAFVAGYQRAMRDLRTELLVDHYALSTEVNSLRLELRRLRQMHDAALEAMHAAQAQRARTLVQAWAGERDPTALLQ